MQGHVAAGGVCSDVFFAFCSIAVLGHRQEKLLMLALFSEARAESFSSEQLGRGALVPWCGPQGVAFPGRLSDCQKSLH